MEPETQTGRLLKMLMEDEQLKEFSIEDYINAIREYVENDLRKYVLDREGLEPAHPAVVCCLEACIDHLSDAGLAYYASLK